MSERLQLELWDSGKYSIYGTGWTARLPSFFSVIPNGFLLLDARIERDGKPDIAIQMTCLRDRHGLSFSGDWRLAPNI